jgi:hypothetical protein
MFWKYHREILYQTTWIDTNVSGLFVSGLLDLYFFDPAPMAMTVQAINNIPWVLKLIEAYTSIS